jgi:uncharacterized protein
MTTRRRQVALTVAAFFTLSALVQILLVPAAGAWLLLHGARRINVPRAPAACESTQFAGAGVVLAGWRCPASGAPRGTLIYVHGISDNRHGVRGLVDRFRVRGFDVVAYDSRAHGESTGDACTYGFYEKRDLRRVIDAARPGPIVLLGHSLGAAVALQEAADDPRVTTVIAAETFTDLRTIVAERAPFFFTRGAIRRGLALAEWLGRFSVDEVSPLEAAVKLTTPVLLIHGDADIATSPEHSRRLAAALAGPKRLLLIPGAGHSQSLRGDVWREIEAWIDQYVPRGGA